MTEEGPPDVRWVSVGQLHQLRGAGKLRRLEGWLRSSYQLLDQAQGLSAHVAMPGTRLSPASVWARRSSQGKAGGKCLGAGELATAAFSERRSLVGPDPRRTL
jgi:hypothetical protein